MKTMFLLLSLAVSGVGLFAQSADRPLPAFTLSDASGRSVSSAELATGGRSVVVFVKPGCRPCEQLLGGIARIADGGSVPRLTVIVESSPDAAAAYVRGLPQPLATVPWLADASAEGWHALELKGLPVVVGIEGPQIAWTHIGAPERRLLEPLMRTWAGVPGGGR